MEDREELLENATGLEECDEEVWKDDIELLVLRRVLNDGIWVDIMSNDGGDDDKEEEVILFVNILHFVEMKKRRLKNKPIDG